jgi:hypothetical protein
VTRRDGDDNPTTTKVDSATCGRRSKTLLLAPLPGTGGSKPVKVVVQERPFGGSCNAVVTPLTEPGVFPEVLKVDLDCLLQHLGRTTAQATTTVVPAGPRVGSTLPISLTSETTYEAANGDRLYQKFAGTGQLDVDTLEVEFWGMETFEGGSGRFVNAVGFANTNGSASFVTNAGFLITRGRLAY